MCAPAGPCGVDIPTKADAGYPAPPPPRLPGGEQGQGGVKNVFLMGATCGTVAGGAFASGRSRRRGETGVGVATYGLAA